MRSQARKPFIPVTGSAPSHEVIERGVFVSNVRAPCGEKGDPSVMEAHSAKPFSADVSRIRPFLRHQ